MFLRNVITWLEKKSYVLSCCGSTLSLVYISSSIVLNLSYLGPLKKKTEYSLLCVSKIMYKRCLQFFGGRLSKVPRETEKMFRQKFGVIFYQHLLRRLD